MYTDNIRDRISTSRWSGSITAMCPCKGGVLPIMTLPHFGFKIEPAYAGIDKFNLKVQIDKYLN
jgi:hypothetical protein